MSRKNKEINLEQELDELIKSSWQKDFSHIKLSSPEKNRLKEHIPKKWWQKSIELSWSSVLTAGLAVLILSGYLLLQLVWISPADLEANKLNEFEIQQKIGQQTIKISLSLEGGQ